MLLWNLRLCDVVFGNVDGVFPRAVFGMEIAAGNRFLGENRRNASFVGDIMNVRLRQEHTNAQFPVVPSRSVRIPSAGIDKMLSASHISLSGEHGVNDVVGENVVRNKR